MDQSDSQLVRRGVRGDPQALHAIVDQHAGVLFTIARSLLSRDADAEDLVQETFLACFAGLRKFEGRSSLRTWLISILMRQAASSRRRQQRRAMLPWSDDLSERPSRESAAPSETQHADSQMDLAAAIAELSDEQREVLMLREYGGLSYEQIAVALALPKGTVESRLHRARQELAQRLKGYAE